MSATTETLRGRRVRSRGVNRPGRLLGAAVLIAAAAGLAIGADAAITLEARLVAWVLSAFTTGGTNAVDHLVYIGLGTDRITGLLITPVCTSLVLIGPILAFTGLLVAIGRKRADWALLGGAIALAIAVTANIARFVLIAAALQLWGQTGFHIMHHYVGAVLVIIASAVAVVVLLVVSSTGRVLPPAQWLAALRPKRDGAER